MATVTLDVELVPTESGGRVAPFNEGYAPHLIASGDQTYLPVRLINRRAWVSPGERARLEFQLLYYPTLDYSRLTAGSAVRVVEGNRIIAIGTVLCFSV